jgi:hypothetical protein
VANWVEQYRRMWEQRLDRLEDYLREVQESPADKPARKARSPKRKSKGQVR